MTPIRISNGMLIAMIVNLIFVKSIGLTQGTLARIVTQDMWIATVLGTLQGLVIMYVTYLAMRRSPRLDFIALGERLAGKWFSVLVALLIFVFFLAGSGPIMMAFVYHLLDYFLPEAPLPVFLVAALLVGMLGCFYGVEVMARSALIGLVFLFALNVLIIIGSTQEFDIRNLLPVMESGLPRNLNASLHYDADWALGTMLAALIMPMMKDPGKNGGKIGMLGIAASGMMIVIWAILEGAVLSAEVTGQYTLSCMKLARNAHIGNFLQRYEMIMIALYALPSLFEIMFCVYGISVSASRIFGMKSNKAMIPVSAVLIGAFDYWLLKDHYRALDFMEHQWLYIALPIAFGLPLLMLAMRLMLGKKLANAQAAGGGQGQQRPGSVKDMQPSDKGKQPEPAGSTADGADGGKAYK
ncbi:spore germination protein (amino acid permease) [Paenibacillus sp. UNC496MF]|uniref:GerAB/ArcD/ProY family transporter n=1 Tax=Paenibacillus sp. UNC496MF TaxID=1502753 RepID=UPI0008F3DA7D|nr:GerAB/ArcD/ProY family transporter [Paenibacillus sp. UNC496MF]SFJ30553.1 spore germination protein (amino acid permease) [Paenibacillus sp. UNC496MF]